MRKLRAWAGDHPGAAIVAAAVILISLFVGWNLLRPTENTRLAAIRKAGYPVTLSELDAWYPYPGTNENGAALYTRAFDLASTKDADVESLLSDKQLTPPRGKPLAPEVQTNFAKLRSDQRELFSVLHEATNYPNCRYAMDLRQGFTVMLPHLAKVKRVTMLLSTEGLYAACQNRPAESAHSFIAAQYVATSISKEPILISRLVEIASSAVTAKRLELAMNLVSFSDADLAALQQGLARAETSGTMARALAGERAFGLSFFINPQVQGKMFSQGGSGFFPQGIGGRIMMTGMKASGLLAKDQDFYLNYMEKTVSLAVRPVEDRFNVAQQAIPQIPTNRFLIFSRMMLPSLTRALDRDNEHVGRMRVARTGLAVERFRLAHQGKPPASLNEVVPAYLDKLPTDLDGSALKFNVLTNGFRVYSIGSDGRDDGGKESEPAKDLTFTVER